MTGLPFGSLCSCLRYSRIYLRVYTADAGGQTAGIGKPSIAQRKTLAAA
jgi:hypothetical protein